MKKIEEFSDNELIEELADRFDHFVMAGRKDAYSHERKAQRRRYFKGDYEVCVGLAHGIIDVTTMDAWSGKLVEF